MLALNAAVKIQPAPLRSINITGPLPKFRTAFWVREVGSGRHRPTEYSAWHARTQQYVITIKQCSIIEIIEIEIVFGMRHECVRACVRACTCACFWAEWGVVGGLRVIACDVWEHTYTYEIRIRDRALLPANFDGVYVLQARTYKSRSKFLFLSCARANAPLPLRS